MSSKDRFLIETAKYVCTKMAQNDAAHDENHVHRVVALTRQLCLAYPQADPFRAELLAWLHDMNDDKLASDVGRKPLFDLLQDMGIAQEDIAFVLEGIGYVSYRKHPHLNQDIPLEIRIVQDADRIDALGAVGIARTFAYGGAKNRPLDESLAHFDEKLLRLYDLLSTDEARRIAKPRYEFLQAFYRQYLQETQ